MLLKTCLSNIEPNKVIGSSLNIDIASIKIDSRKVKNADLFVAIRGTTTDGHNYIKQAIANGATAVLCEELPAEQTPSVIYIQVDNSEESLGVIASNFYNNPSSQLKLVGVTGTNGKTTTATLLYKLFKKMGYKAGLLSTVCNYIDTREVPTTHTTPDPIIINELLAKMVQVGCDFAFMEVSSHAVVQHRITGLNFAGGVFTNLTRDHLDYHKTVSNYIKAKKAFFDQLPEDAFSLTNIDDKNGNIMVQNTASTIKSYSLKQTADFKGKILEQLFEGMLIDINSREITLQFTGTFNAYNILAVYGTAILLGQNRDEILVALSALKSVSGRFETLQSPNGYTAIVDYAHTPDALNNVLNTIHEILKAKGHIITVCGAGGNRDKGKRPLMTKEALRYSDKLILTSDNPRYEDPEEIIQDMLEGITPEDRGKIVAITNRREAIRTACFLAKANDVILIAGKGHENYQSIQGVNHHFDDKEEVRNIFNTLN